MGHMRNAYQLYSFFDFDVYHLHMTATEAVPLLLNQNYGQFHLVYIDGQHTGISPMYDFMLSLAVVKSGANVMLDDWGLWPDVHIVKKFCDLNYRRVWDTWKVAVYSIL